MKREIKFRVWDKDKHRMFGIAQLAFDINGELVSIYSNGPDFSNDSEALMGEEPSLNKAVLMEYTGLKDANGKEIYEGDLVILTNDLEDPIYKVIFDEAKFEIFGGGVFYDLGEEFMNCEVIGNIYEKNDCEGKQL